MRTRETALPRPGIGTSFVTFIKTVNGNTFGPSKKPVYKAITVLHRNHLAPRKESTVNQNAARSQVPTLKPAMKLGTHPKQMAEPTALEKITALESELFKLRAQIAMIITDAPGSGSNDKCLHILTHTPTHTHLYRCIYSAVLTSDCISSTFY